MFPSRNRRERAAAVDNVIEQVTSWPGVTTAPHQVDGVEFQLFGIVFGQLHRDGRLEVPFVRRIRDALVEDGAARSHPWVPNSGWVVFEVSDREGADHAVFLLRLSYLCRAVMNPRIEVPAAWMHGALADPRLEGRVAAALEELTAAAEI